VKGGELLLGDGRRLAYDEYGPPGGRAVLFFHPMPGARLMGRCMAAPAADMGLRVVAPDRPGIGGSDPKPGRRILDWPDDVVELADALGIERFSVVASSGGGPYALACASKIPERVEAVALVSSVAPLIVPEALREMGPQPRMMYRLTRWAPWTIRPAMALIAASSRRFPDGLRAQMNKSASGADRQVLADPEAFNIIWQGGEEAFRQGSRWAAAEVRLSSRPWGFDLGDIAVPVDVWQGEADEGVTPAVGRWLAQTIPGARLHMVPDAGHFWVIHHMDEVLLALTGGSPTPE